MIRTEQMPLSARTQQPLRRFSNVRVGERQNGRYHGKAEQHRKQSETDGGKSVCDKELKG
jgi:hypothetical protein